MTTAFNTLLDLIQSLKPGEKRDFTKYSKFWSEEKETKYREVFEYILAGIHKYDSDPIKIYRHVLSNINVKTQRDNSTPRSKHYHKPSQPDDSKQEQTNIDPICRFLTDKILEAMRATQTYSLKEKELHNLFLDINFLHHKALYEHCLHLIKKAKKLAIEIDKRSLILDLNIYQKSIITRLGNSDLVDHINKIQQEEYLELERLHQKNKIQNNNIIITHLAKSTNQIKIEDFQIIDPSTDRLNEGVFWAKLYYHQLKSGINLASRSSDGPLDLGKLDRETLETLLKHEEAIYQLYESTPYMKKEDPGMYWLAIDRYLTVALLLEKYELFDQIEKANDSFVFFEKNIYFYRNISYIYIIKLIKQLQFAKCESFIEEHNIFEYLFHYRKLMPQQRFLVLLYYCVLISFLFNKFKETIRMVELFEKTEYLLKQNYITTLLFFFKVLSKIEVGKYHKTEPDSKDLNILKARMIKDGSPDEEVNLIFETLDTIFQNPPNLPVNEDMAPFWKRAQNLNGVDLRTGDYAILYCWMQSKAESKPVIEVFKSYC